MDTRVNRSDIEILTDRIAFLEQELRSERAKSFDLERQLAMTKALMLDLEEKAAPMIAEEYRILMQEHDEGNWSILRSP